MQYTRPLFQRTTSTVLRKTSWKGVRASFWRGGTSNGLLIHGPDLPIWNTLTPEQKSRIDYLEDVLRPFFAGAMGSPDPYGRQLNGMGGGVSSLSKAIIAEKSKEKGVDVDYYFVQIGIKDGMLDMAGNCGNMTSAVAPFAVNAGILRGPDLVQQQQRSRGSRESSDAQMMSILIKNMNTNKLIKADIQVDNVAEDNGDLFFKENGDYVLDGVSGTASPITLSFLSPAGAKTGKALPTGNAIDVLLVDGEKIEATLTDISNPGIFIDGRQIGWDPLLKPELLTAKSELMSHLEAIRRAGTSKMGLNPDVPSIPKIILVYPPEKDDIDIRCQGLSMQQAHKAVPVTLGLNLGVTSKITGSIPHRLARQRDPQNTIIGHPSGKMEVGAEIDGDRVKGAKLVRTARWLMDGFVNDGP